MVGIAEIQGLDDVRPAALEEHHGFPADILDDERLSFMTAQGAAGLRPDHLHILDVAGIDLVERAVAVQTQVARRSAPLVWIFEAFKLFGIRRVHCGTTGRY